MAKRAEGGQPPGPYAVCPISGRRLDGLRGGCSFGVGNGFFMCAVDYSSPIIPRREAILRE